MRLKGKVAIITGAASGMGRAMAELFCAEGAKVVAGDWHQEQLDEAIEAISAGGGSIIGRQGNIAEEATSDELVNTAVESFGKLDIVCNNAGVMDNNHPVGSVSNEMWQRVLGINLNGPMYLTRRAIPALLESGGGSIVNTASLAGLGGGAAGVAYTVSKHALVGLTRNTAFVYTQQGIRCNAIAAGAVETNIMQSIDPTLMDQAASARYNTWYAAIPGQLKSTDIANLALFLASDESKMINGAIIPADAGWSAA